METPAILKIITLAAIFVGLMIFITGLGQRVRAEEPIQVVAGMAIMGFGVLFTIIIIALVKRKEEIDA